MEIVYLKNEDHPPAEPRWLLFECIRNLPATQIVKHRNGDVVRIPPENLNAQLEVVEEKLLRRDVVVYVREPLRPAHALS